MCKASRLLIKCRTWTKAALEEALDEGLIMRNPAKRLTVPLTTKPEDQSYRRLDEVAVLLRELGNTRDRLILRMLVLSGLRPHELFALRWEDMQGRQVIIDETLEYGKPIDAANTKRSIGYVGIPESLRRELLAWKKESKRRRPRSGHVGCRRQEASEPPGEEEVDRIGSFHSEKFVY